MLKRLEFFIVSLLLFVQFSRAQEVNFNFSHLSNLEINNPTSLDFGPDGKLYVSQQDGMIKQLEIAKIDLNSFAVVSSEDIDLVKKIPNHNDDGQPINLGARQITGILVIGTAQNPIILVSSSDPRIGGVSNGGDINLDTNSGILSRLTWDGSKWVKVDLIRGLPRSEENHANNGMAYDANNNELFLTVGGMTNAGAPSFNFGYITEYAYAACILRVDLNAINQIPIKENDTDHSYVYDLPTLDDPTRPNVGGITDPLASGYIGDIGDPFGGNDGLNQAKVTIDSPVQVFSGGYRNAYDIVLNSEGRLYTWDNGANQNWGGHPENEGSSQVTNNWVAGEPGSSSDGPNDSIVNNKDGLHFIGNISDENQTYYGGHPTPIRANPSGAGLYTHSGGNGHDGTFRSQITSNTSTTLPIDWPPFPESLKDIREGDFQNSGIDDPSLYNIISSTNGMVEYPSTALGGELFGDLLAASFNGAIYRVKLNKNGKIDSPADVSILAQGFGQIPLDVTAQANHEIFPGTIWVADYGADTIIAFEPSQPFECTGIYSLTLDDDKDGYSNADEVDSGSNPCNSSDIPLDNDEDFIPDFNDPDDDNDGIGDILDVFPLDSENGNTTEIPINYELLNGDPGFGFYGLGFTGLKHNSGTNYADLFYNEDNSNVEIIAGGAVGLLTINSSPEGTSLNSENTQKNGFQFGVKTSDLNKPFTISSEILNSEFLDDDSHTSFFIGDGTQDNYISFGLNKDGIQLTQEQDGKALVTHFADDSVTDADSAKLSLHIDPSKGIIQPSFQIGSNEKEFLDVDIKIPDHLDQNILSSAPFAVGIESNNPHAKALNSTWDSINVNYSECNSKGTWNQLFSDNNSFQQRHEAGYVRAGNLFYLIGGRGNKALNIYNPRTQQWKVGTSPPYNIHHFQPVEVEGEIWIAGAFLGEYPNESPLDKILIYNPASDTWRDGPNIPNTRLRGSCGVVYNNRNIFLICGIQNGHIDGHVTWVDRYDLESNTWTILPDAPRARDHFQSVVIGNKIWNAAGRQSKANVSPNGVFKFTLPEIDFFDLETLTWNTLPEESNIPTQRAGNAAINYFGKLLVIGGESTQANAHNEVEAFNVEDFSWESLPPLLNGRHGTGAIEFHGAIYIASGSGNQGGGPELSTQEQYAPDFTIRSISEQIPVDNLIPVAGDTIILEGVSGSNSQYAYLGVNVNNKTIVANRENEIDATEFLVSDAGDGQVALSYLNSYTSSENGNAPIHVNRSSIGEWEKFSFELLDNGLIAIKGSNEKYWSSENGLIPLTCNRSSIGSWEQFQWKKTNLPEPIITVTSTTHTQSVLSGETEFISAKIKNNGDAILNIASITSSNSVFDYIGSIASQLAPNQEQTLLINFVPGFGYNEAYSGTLTILSDASNQPALEINLFGERINNLLDAPSSIFNQAEGHLIYLGQSTSNEFILNATNSFNENEFSLLFQGTPTEQDLTGTVLLTEIGDNKSGMGLYLINAIPTFIQKRNSSSSEEPDNLMDLTLPESAIQSEYGALIPNELYTIGIAYAPSLSTINESVLSFSIYKKDGNITSERFLFPSPLNIQEMLGDRSYSISRASETFEAGGLTSNPGILSQDSLRSFLGVTDHSSIWNTQLQLTEKINIVEFSRHEKLIKIGFNMLISDSDYTLYKDTKIPLSSEKVEIKTLKALKESPLFFDVPLEPSNATNFYQLIKNED